MIQRQKWKQDYKMNIQKDSLSKDLCISLLQY